LSLIGPRGMLRLALSGRLVVDPWPVHPVRSTSLVLHLGNRGRRLLESEDPLDLTDPREAERNAGPEFEFSRLEVRPGDFLLLRTHERLRLPADLAGVLSNLSHLARLGLDVHLGSTFVQAGFGSTRPTPLTLEVSSRNPTPLTLRPMMPICHLALAEIRGSHPILGTYDGTEGLAPSLISTELASPEGRP